MNFTQDRTNSAYPVKRNTQSRYAACDTSNYNQEQQQPQRRSRINFSPLKSPLESAINKVVSTFGREPSNGGSGRRAPSPVRFSSTPKNRFLINSSSSQINNTSVDVYEEDKEALEKMHPEAMEFLKKYFSGYSASHVPTVTFIDYLSKEFSSLWTESQAKGKHQSNAAILPEFIHKLFDRLGQEHVQMGRLCGLVKENGLIGLILGIFRQLKEEQQYLDDSKEHNGRGSLTSDAPSSRYVSESKQTLEGGAYPELQNVKNIIQEFTEGLYKSTENEIYSRLNGEMRRLVMKYKETESLLKTVNDRINQDIDKLHYQRKKTQLEKTHESAVERLNDRIKSLETQLHKQRLANNTLRVENEKFSFENRKLTDTVDKFQNHLLGKAEEPDLKFRSVQGSAPQQQPIVSFAYQSPQSNSTIYNNRSTTPIKTTHTQGHLVDNRKGIMNTTTTTTDKQNVVTLNTLNGMVRPTTPIKGMTKPSASPARYLRVPRS